MSRPVVNFAVVKHGQVGAGMFDRYVVSLNLTGETHYRRPGGDPLVAQAGQTVIVYPGTQQDWRVESEEDWSVFYIVTEISRSWSHLINKEQIVPGMARVDLSEDTFALAHDAFVDMLKWSNTQSPLSADLIMNRLHHILLLIKSEEPQHDDIDFRIQRAAIFLQNNIETPISLNDVVEHALLSKAQLSKLFQESMGTSPMQYLERMRLDHAAQLLAYTMERVDDIAERLCYNDPGYFAKRFKAAFGTTPRQYRLSR